MAATKTIVREHEADLVVQAADIVADGVLAPSLADDLTRQYSLCSSPGTPGTWRIGVLRTPDGRGGSERVHGALQAGATVRVRGPRNHSPLVTSPRYLFVAGGIGITPLLPMIRAAAATGSDWTLAYGGRRRATMAFLPELEPYGDRVRLFPADETGRLDLAALLGAPQPGTAVYCCGPEGLLTDVEARCKAWPPG